MALKLSGTSGGLRIKGSGGSMRIKVEPTSFTLLSTDFSVYYTGNAIVASDTSGFVNLSGGGGVNNLVTTATRSTEDRLASLECSTGSGLKPASPRATWATSST